jgi:hypothetical protein
MPVAKYLNLKLELKSQKINPEHLREEAFNVPR